MSTKKRKVYDVQTKQNIIDDFNNKEKNKETIDDIMKKYDIRTTSTFYTIINPKNQEKLKNVMYNELRPPTTRKIKLAIYPDVEKAMEMWFKEVKKNKDVTLDGPLMQQLFRLSRWYNEDGKFYSK